MSRYQSLLNATFAYDRQTVPRPSAYLANANRVAAFPDTVLPNAGPASPDDKQRKAMFAAMSRRGGGGGGGVSTKKGGISAGSKPKPPAKQPRPPSSHGSLSPNPPPGAMHNALAPPAGHVWMYRPNGERVAVPSEKAKPFLQPRPQPWMPGPVLPQPVMPQPPGYWPGGTPPWIYDPIVGGPNPGTYPGGYPGSYPGIQPGFNPNPSQGVYPGFPTPTPMPKPTPKPPPVVVTQTGGGSGGMTTTTRTGGSAGAGKPLNWGDWQKQYNQLMDRGATPLRSSREGATFQSPDGGLIFLPNPPELPPGRNVGPTYGLFGAGR
jgi:hypothetical protein